MQLADTFSFSLIIYLFFIFVEIIAIILSCWPLSFKIKNKSQILKLILYE